MEFPDNCRVCLNWSSPAAMRSPRLDFGPAWRHGLCPCRWRTVSTLPMRQLGRWHSCCLRCTSSRCRQVWVKGRGSGHWGRCGVDTHTELNSFACLHSQQAYHVTDAALGYFSPKQSHSLSILRLQSCWELTNHGIVNIGKSRPCRNRPLKK